MQILKRLIGFVVGLVYAVLLGLFSMLMTGGGHGNVIWILLFFATLFGGFFYPLMGLIVADLKPKASKIAFIAVFLLHLALVCTFFFYGIDESNSTSRDLTWEEHPYFISLMVILFSLPQLVLVGVFIKNVVQEWKPSFD